MTTRRSMTQCAQRRRLTRSRRRRTSTTWCAWTFGVRQKPQNWSGAERPESGPRRVASSNGLRQLPIHARKHMAPMAASEDGDSMRSRPMPPKDSPRSETVQRRAAYCPRMGGRSICLPARCENASGAVVRSDWPARSVGARGPFACRRRPALAARIAAPAGTDDDHQPSPSSGESAPRAVRPPRRH